MSRLPTTEKSQSPTDGNPTPPQRLDTATPMFTLFDVLQRQSSPCSHPATLWMLYQTRDTSIVTPKAPREFFFTRQLHFYLALTFSSILHSATGFKKFTLILSKIEYSTVSIFCLSAQTLKLTCQELFDKINRGPYLFGMWNENLSTK